MRLYIPTQPLVQLQGDVARAIAGLPLTKGNYPHSIELLENRFGQTHELINTHMQALLDMPNPNKEKSSKATGQYRMDV